MDARQTIAVEAFALPPFLNYASGVVPPRSTPGDAMPAPATSDDFLEHLRISSLVEESRLDQYLNELRQNSSMPGDPNFLAGRLVHDGLLTSFQAQQLLEGRYKNFIVGKYKLLEPLGSGGMSTVFLCEHQDTGRRFAMKVLSLRRGADPGMLARFLREARIISSLNHPNIVRAYEIDCNCNKIPYIIMDFVEGVPFDELIKNRGALEPTRAAHYIAQAASGLQHLHDAALIHRDVKPGNLVLDRDGVVKLLDLGLARFQQDFERITEKFNGCAILGTADFISPEQTQVTGNLDNRSDIYSLGATFYYLLAGQVPFPARCAADKIRGHQSVEAIALERLRPDIPSELAQIVRKMMAKKPADRHGSAKEVARQLARWSERYVPPPDASDFQKLPNLAPNRDHTGIANCDSSSLAALRAAVSGSPRTQWNRLRLWLTLGVGIAALAGAIALFVAVRG